MKLSHSVNTIFTSILFMMTGAAFSSTVYKTIEYENVREFVTCYFRANVNIITFKEDSQKVTLKFSGDQSLEAFLTRLRVSNYNGVLTLDDYSRSTNMLGGRVIAGKRLIVNGGDATNAAFGPSVTLTPTLDVILSCKTPLKLDASKGSWTLNKTLVAFKAKLGSQVRMTIRSLMNGAKINMSSDSDLKVAQILGNKLSVDVSGSRSNLFVETVDIDNIYLKTFGENHLTIKDGIVKEIFETDASGRGTVTFQGVARSAKISMGWSDQVYIREVTGQVQHSALGQESKLNIVNRPDI